MLDEHCIPRIETNFDGSHNAEVSSRYCEIIRDMLKKILPSYLFSERATLNQKDHFQILLPLVTSTPCKMAPEKMSFYILAKYRSNSFKFFFEMISRWLVPGKRLNVVLIYAADFRMPDLSNEIYTVCEIIIQVEDDDELNLILKNLPLIEAEVKLGLESSYHARRILEIKGSAVDEKIALIHENIAYLVKRLPKIFDIDVLTEMQHILIMCRDEFKAVRNIRHLSKLISFQYLFRKDLREAVKEAPEKRHLRLKLFKSVVNFSGGSKSVLGILVGVNFIRDKEVFEKKHILDAIKNNFPTAQVVEGSFFANRHGNENICILYVEIENGNGLDFSLNEIKTLGEFLSSDLKERIEHLMHPVFMPRNEEEIMRNILSLSNQIKYLRDIPQVIISFDEQTRLHLSFTVTLVRVMMPGSESLQKMFKDKNSFLEYVHDRSKMVGFLRKKYTKEATVFRVKLPKERFLRRDHSLDLYKARQVVVAELSNIVGDFRDFNGGMIMKQNELLHALKELLHPVIKYSDHLLENFFFSLMPVMMRTLLEPEALKTLFIMLLESIEKGLNDEIKYSIHRDIDFIFVLIKTMLPNQQEALNKAFYKLNLQSTELAHAHVTVHEIPYNGYIFRCDDPHKQHLFCQAIQAI